jgi:hypothetical protein
LAILSRTKISPQQRYDLEDYFAEQSAARADEKLYTQKFLSELNLILGGFTVSGIGLNAATVGMTGAALIVPQNTSDFSYFVSAPAEADVVIPDADLVDAARNYLEVELVTQDGTPLTKAFWDPEASSGAGSEFNQIVNTITDLRCNFVVSTGGFSGLPNRLPIAMIDVNGSGTIKLILDRRNLYGRLAKPNNLDNSYAWGSKVEPVYSLNMTSVAGVFVAGETITIGGETATVVTGGTTAITFNAPTGVNFANGSSVVGGTSGATGTVNTVSESFTGVDKSLKGQKQINDALMTEIKNIKGKRFWWMDGPSTGGVKAEVQSTIAPISSAARVAWDGSNVIITDDSLTPATTDDLAAIRILSSTANLILRRQDDGKEVTTINLSAVPTSGTLTIDQAGFLTAIPRTATTAQIQTAWNSSGAYAATISGSPADGKIVITANAAGLRTDIITSSNTFAKAGNPVTESYVIKQGMAADTSIPLADGQVLYVDLPSPLASANYSGLGSGATNFKVANRGSVALTDSAYWLGYREGSRLIWRFAGELQSGESSQISDNVPQSLLDAIGLLTESSLPNYSSNIRGSQNESIVKRSSVLTDAAGDAQEDRSGYLRSDGQVTWSGTQVSFVSDVVLELVNTKTGTTTTHKCLVANSPITVNDGESVWMLIDRTQTTETCTVNRSSIIPIPAQTQANKDVFVLFRRHDVASAAYLHIPFMKALMLPGQAVTLGQSGSGGGLSKVTFHDPVSTTLPTGSSVTIDGVLGVNGDLVLYSNLSSGNNEVYELQGVGTSITWTAKSQFSGSVTPLSGDAVIIQKGNSFASAVGIFSGTTWKFNDYVRYFNGADYWEQSAVLTSTLANNSTGNVFAVAATGSENLIVDFSVVRSGIKETGTIWITHDGTNAFLTSGGAYSGSTGLTFAADISLGTIRLRYTSDNSGSASTMKFIVRRWSDSVGGPNGLPSYSGGGGGSTAAAGSSGDVQFNVAGVLAADTNFKWDSSDESLNLNGLRMGALSAGLTIADNQVSPTALFTFPKSYNFAIIEYSIVRNGIYRTGTLLVSNDGALTSSNGSYVETGISGVALTTDISGANVRVLYTSTSTGFAGSLKFSMRKWS